MKYPRLLLFFAALCAVLPVQAQQSRDNDPLTDTVANGRGVVNYNTGVVRAKGYAAPPNDAENAAQARLMTLGGARADALRTLAMAVSSVQVTASTTVKNYILRSDMVQTNISALLQSARVVSEDTQRDGSAVVFVEIPLYGENSVASCVFPEIYGARKSSDARARPTESALPDTSELSASAGESIFKGPDQPAVRIERVPVANRYNRPGNPALRLTPADDSGPFSSVIVDCRGLGINAVMSPKLMDTAGREVYGTVRVTPEYAIETGIVSYPRSAAQALTVPRAGGHPLVVRALRAGDKHSFNPVIALEDADRILASNNRDHFLERTAVIFLVDPVR